MKRLVLTLAISLAFALGGMAQNIWKPIDVSAVFLGAAPDGSLYFNCGYSGIGPLSRRRRNLPNRLGIRNRQRLLFQ